MNTVIALAFSGLAPVLQVGADDAAELGQLAFAAAWEIFVNTRNCHHRGLTWRALRSPSSGVLMLCSETDTFAEPRDVYRLRGISQLQTR